jgi:hypothetical protein
MNHKISAPAKIVDEGVQGHSESDHFGQHR